MHPSRASFFAIDPIVSGNKPTLAAQPALLALCMLAIGVSLAFPAGFAGWDDLHYVQGAQTWLTEGVHVPANHWATRLPYVLTIAASLRLFGLSSFALTLPNTILFTIMLLLLWHIARQMFDARAAFCTTFVVVTTPLFFRMPTTYYPEVMEVVFAAGATALTMAALSRGMGRERILSLLAAGLVGGSGIVVRQTALALPIALSVLILLSDRTPAGRLRPRRSATGILVLGIGYAVPVLAEMLFYLAMTGNPLERLLIDSRHVLIPSAHMVGGTFRGGSPLFNWKLAAEWDVPSPVKLHWTINPLLRVFIWQGLLLTPWLCLAGGVLATRIRGPARLYAIFAGTGFLTQYLLDTFVLAIAPDTRYLSSSIALTIPLAGFLMARLSRSLLLGAGLLLLLPCLLVMTLAPEPAHLMPALARYASRGEPVHISPELMDASLILRTDRPELAKRLQVMSNHSKIPAGALAVIDSYGWTGSRAGQKCVGGQDKWQQVDSVPAPSVPWIMLHAAGLDRWLPGSIDRPLERPAGPLGPGAERLLIPWRGAPADFPRAERLLISPARSAC